MADSRRLDLEIRAAARLKEQLVATYGDDAELVRDSIEGETSLHEAIGAAVLELAAVESEKEGIEIAIAKLKERLDRHCRKAQGIRGAIFTAMEVAELPSIKTPAATLTVRASAPKVEIVEQSLIPPIYWTRPDPVLDKRAVAEAVKNGEVIPGAVLSNAAPALSVRFK
jgi:hypothetical protein